MAYVVPIDQPLTETQAKLIAQVGSMKNLTDLSFLKKFKLKKGDEISLFDYLIKVLRAMGIDPQILLTAFLNDFFKTEKLVEVMLTGAARLATAAKKNILNETLSFEITSEPLTEEQKKELTDVNYNYLNSGMVKTSIVKAVDVLKTRMVQELMVLIFGKPKKTEAAYGTNGLVYDEDRFNELIDESVCGGNAIFSISSPANNNFGDLEYNRIQKIEQVKNGNLTFKITCQGVQISLPDDPMYLFKTVPTGFQGSESVSPQDAILNVFNFVGNQIQKDTSGGSSQSNAKTASKSFIQKFLETLISSITCLMKSFFVGFIETKIPGEAQGIGDDAITLLTNGLLNKMFPGSVVTNSFTGQREGEFVPATSCEISNYDKNNLSLEQKKKTTLMTILCNLILNMVIGFILSYVIEKVKKMIIKYIAKRAQARMTRKIDKIKNKVQFSVGFKITKKAEKAVRQVKLMKTVINALQALNNTFTIPNIQSS